MSAEPVVLVRGSWRSRVLLPTLLVLGVACLLAAFFLPLPGTRPPAPPLDADGLPVPEFRQTERQGATITNQDLLGKVWIAAFVFTRCAGPCPSVAATLSQLQTELKLAERDELRIVTFTIDPDRDTPDELQKYADRFQAHPTRWLFLTGPENQQHELATTGFKILANRSTEAEPKAGMEFDHSTKLAVVDKQGRIRGYFDGYQGAQDTTGERFTQNLSRLKERVELLLNEK